MLDKPVASNLPSSATRPTPSSFSSSFWVEILTKKCEKNMFPEFVWDDSQMLLGCSGHVKTCFKMILTSGNSSEEINNYKLEI